VYNISYAQTSFIFQINMEHFLRFFDNLCIFVAYDGRAYLT